MPLAAGTRFGLYEIVEQIGAGGMGEVYRATDTKLGRDVAIKILPSALADDGDRLARFEREAKLLAALNHAHIAAVYGLDEHDGTQFLAMELVAGETLEQRLRSGRLPVEDALRIGLQITEALEAAHDKGVVHRDLKPENVMVTRDGVVKVLDFGLAKAFAGNPSEASPAHSPALSLAMTQQGLILGTAGYMSPEQASGQATDQRADVWAFGVVLYEMLTGLPLFSGESVPHVLADVLRSEPDWRRLPRRLHPRIRQLLERCLEKKVRNRYHSIADVRVDIESALTDPTGLTAAAPPGAPAGRRALPLAAGVVAGAVLAGAAVWALTRPAPLPVSRFEASVPSSVTFGNELSVSPDGRRLVFTAGGAGLWIRDFSGHEWQRVPGTEGGSTPFWSPDGRYLGFIVGRQLRRLDMTGGPPETLAALAGGGGGSAGWNLNGDIVLGSWGGGSGGPLWKVSQTGGVATALTQVDVSRGELYHTWPTFLPDGSSFLYFRSGPPDVAGMYVGSLDAAPAEQSRQRIFPSAMPAIYANGHVFFLRGSTLMAQPFDARHLQLEPDAVPVAEDVEISWFSTGVFAVSDSGALAYRASSAIGTFQLTWFDRQGETLGTIGPPSTDESVALSPDGTRAVVKDSPYGVPGDLWTLDLASGARTRLTLDRNAYSPGVWSPDGTLIAFAAGDSGDTLYAKAASGLGGARELLTEPGLRHYATSWSRDGRFLLYHTENAPNSGYDLWLLSMDSGRPHLLLGEAFNEWAGTFSPDMRWLAYSSLEAGGSSEVYVRPFLVSAPNGEPAVGERKWQISEEGGNWALWRYDREIVFNDFPTERAAFSVPVDTSGGDLQRGVSQRLEPLWVNSVRADSTEDGQRFLIAVPQVQGTDRASIRVVLNWPALFAR
jgi:Tol biopolymer transport system component